MEILLPMAHCHATDKLQSSSGLTFALQALLDRHESYVSESQQEHQRLTAYIEKLEKESTSRQAKSEKIVEENRRLLTQLEDANASLKDRDSHVKGLEALLRDCEVEGRRLNGLCQRTEQLELKILELEKGRMMLVQQAADAEEETRSTIKRWRESEVKVRQLEQETQRIEWDARKDKERYQELITRLEQERVLERELGGAEGRLKGAAALRGLNGKAKGTNVVSHFVRDILQDNANLQAGIVEMRELLQISNEEVQSLRDQILQHQPVEDNDAQSLSRSIPLSEQIGWSQSSPKTQAVHVHHHYHAKLGKRERTPTIRRSSRKRTIVGLGMLPSTPEPSAPTTPIVGPHRFISSPLLPTSLHQPQPIRSRWSVQSNTTSSSMASNSSKSYFEQHSSIFDRLEAGEDSSRPTSPESTGFATSPLKFSLPPAFREVVSDEFEEEEGESRPVVDLAKDKGVVGSKDSADSAEQQQTVECQPQELTPKPSKILITKQSIDSSIPPEPPDSALQKDVACEVPSTKPAQIVVVEEPVPQPSLPEQVSDAGWSRSPRNYEDAETAMIPALRRTGSHDSLMSISGMDIHIAKRPTPSASKSDSILKGNKAYFALPPTAARRMPSAQPLATVTEYTALSSMRSFSSNSVTTPSAQLSLPPRSVSSSVAALTGIANPPTSQSSSGGFTRLVGGWVRGRWGIAPVKSSADLRSSAAPVSTSSSSDSQGVAPFSFPGGRMPGINQKGPIAGLRSPQRITTVQVTKLNEEGLKDTLAE